MSARRHVLLTSAALAATGIATLLSSPSPALAQQEPLTGRQMIDRLVYPPLDFEQPQTEHYTVLGVPVISLEDPTLPMVTVHAYFRGGYGLFGRESYAAAMGLPALLRYGGTTSRSALEVDEAIEYHAFQVSFGSAGGSVTTSINALTGHLPTALDLWGELLAEPAFDGNEVEAWRTRELESVLRRP